MFRITLLEQAEAAGEVEVEVGAITVITTTTTITTMPRVAATTTVATHKGVDTLATVPRRAAVSTTTSQADEDVEDQAETDFRKLALNPVPTF